jgi:hypothetical protein
MHAPTHVATEEIKGFAKPPPLSSFQLTHHGRHLERWTLAQGSRPLLFLSIRAHNEIIQILNVVVYFLFLGSNLSTICVPNNVYHTGKQTYITPSGWAFVIWSAFLLLSNIQQPLILLIPGH